MLLFIVLILIALDVDECSVNNGGCGHNCINTPGSSVCTCNSGYSLNVDKKSCQGGEFLTLFRSGGGGCGFRQQRLWTLITFLLLKQTLPNLESFSKIYLATKSHVTVCMT